MNHGGGRMTAKREGKQKQHLDALREVCIHRRHNAMETVLAKISRHQSEMIRTAVRTEFRSHGIKKIEKPERRVNNKEEVSPRAGKRRQRCSQVQAKMPRRRDR